MLEIWGIGGPGGTCLLDSSMRRIGHMCLNHEVLEDVPYQLEFEVPGCVLIMFFMDRSHSCAKNSSRMSYPEAVKKPMPVNRAVGLARIHPVNSKRVEHLEDLPEGYSGRSNPLLYGPSSSESTHSLPIGTSSRSCRVITLPLGFAGRQPPRGAR